MTQGQRIYYHGCLSLLASVLLVVIGLFDIYAWRAPYILSLMFGTIAGWHMGNLLKVCWK